MEKKLQFLLNTDLGAAQSGKHTHLDMLKFIYEKPMMLGYLFIMIPTVVEIVECIPLIHEMMKINMKPSEEFRKFGQYFLENIDLLISPGEEIYEFSLRHFKGQERIYLRKFIDLALEKASDEVLQRLWDSVDADIYFPTGKDLRAMLTGARDRLR